MTPLNESALPRRFRQPSPDVLEIRDGGGMIALLGLIFLLPGALMGAFFTGLLPRQPSSGGNWTQPAFVLMGMLFLVLGTVFVFGRQWLKIERGRGLVVIQHGLLVPLRTRSRSLSEFRGVSVIRVRGDSESVDRYPVRLQARFGEDLTISRPSQFGEARQQAEYLARWLQLPWADETTDHVTVLAGNHAGDSLHERFQAETAEAAPQPPKRMRSQVFESDLDIQIVIPGNGNMLTGIVAAFFMTVMLLVVFPVLRQFSPSQTGAPLPVPVLLLIVGIFVVPNALLLIGLLASKRKKTVVTASAGGLEIQLGTPSRTPVKRIPGDQIVDIDFSTFEGALRAVRRAYSGDSSTNDPPRGIFGFLARRINGEGIVVKSKQDWINFGEQLPADELRYLAWLLRKTLGRHRT